ncbi:hypothetical protein C8R45DRAFT_940053 [Mycena sanguinolenta]|nr:hypothetical protein C8R45DRAFT_940053 [Mycena sanguinolenta]
MSELQHKRKTKSDASSKYKRSDEAKERRGQRDALRRHTFPKNFDRDPAVREKQRLIMAERRAIVKARRRQWDSPKIPSLAEVPAGRSAVYSFNVAMEIVARAKREDPGRSSPPRWCDEISDYSQSIFGSLGSSMEAVLDEPRWIHGTNMTLHHQAMIAGLALPVVTEYQIFGRNILFGVPPRISLERRRAICSWREHPEYEVWDKGTDRELGDGDVEDLEYRLSQLDI